LQDIIDEYIVLIVILVAVTNGHKKQCQYEYNVILQGKAINMIKSRVRIMVSHHLIVFFRQLNLPNLFFTSSSIKRSFIPVARGKCSVATHCIML